MCILTIEKVSGTYDIIFADPPYDFSLEQFTNIAAGVFKNNLLDPEGILIIEHSKHTKLHEAPYYQETRNYGGNAFSFFELPESNEEE